MTNPLEKYRIDYLLPIAIWLLIFYKNLSNLLLVDYTQSTFFDISKMIQLSNYGYVFSILDIFKLILYPLNLYSYFFTFSILISMMISYFYIKKLFKDKSLLFSVLFSAIFFFNPFTYSRIMIGHLAILIAYLALPVYLFYLFNFFTDTNKKSLIKLAIVFTICSTIAIHFFAINFIIFLVAFFWFYKKDIKKTKYLAYFIIFILLLLLLNSFWLQSMLSNKIFSVINSQHEDFFSPKMSENIPAVAKILGMYGFWREAGYSTTYKSFPLFIWYPLLFIIIALFLLGFYFNTDKKSRFFFTLFWIGLILGTGISHPYTKPFFDALFQNLPFFNGFRDSHKLVVLIAISYAYFIPITILKIKEKTKNKILSYLPILLSIILILSFTYPLIGLDNQIKSLAYPQSYFQVNDYLQQQNIQGNIIYLPWQQYLTYSWSQNSSSDGRISVPINQIIKPQVMIGADQYGTSDQLNSQITDCINQKSIRCLENLNIQYILKDKCAFFPDEYDWINTTKINSTKTISTFPTPVLKTDCIDVYEIIPATQHTQQTQQSQQSIPPEFIIGILVSLITLIILIYILVKRN